MFKAPGIERLKLKYHELLSLFVSKFNVRRYGELVGRTPEMQHAVASRILKAEAAGAGHAAVLGVPAAAAARAAAPGASAAGAARAARAAYRASALLVHPDKCLLPDAKRAFQALTAAYKGFKIGGGGGGGATVPYGAAGRRPR